MAALRLALLWPLTGCLAEAAADRCEAEACTGREGDDDFVGLMQKSASSMFGGKTNAGPLQMVEAQRSALSDKSGKPAENAWGLQDAKIADILAGMSAELRKRGGNAGRSLVVLGNTGGDMDSVVDAIAVATFLQNGTYSNFLAHESPPFGNEPGCNGTYSGVAKEQICEMYDAIFPVINYKRDYLHLRPDEEFVLLQMLNISKEDLIFIDDIHVDNSTRFFLVDHNSINAPEFRVDGKDRASQVDFVVDHHNRKVGEPAEGSIDCYINLVGSCASTVATLIHEANSTFFLENPQWATLLLAAMHQDFDPEKTQQYDLDIMASASQWSLWSKQLLRRKRSVEGFSVEDFFLKDAKDGKSGGVAFTMPELPIHNMSAFMSGADSGQHWSVEDFQKNVTDYLDNYNYDAIFLLKVADQSPPPGEFAVITKSASLVKFMNNSKHLVPKGNPPHWYLDEDPNLKKSLESESPFRSLKPPLQSGYWTYEQGSRKQILPMVNDMLSVFGGKS